MPFLEWKPEMETGFTVIDDQHRVLVDMLNDFHETYVIGDTESMKKLVGKMFDYTNLHFDTEEAYFQEFAYLDMYGHTFAHNAFRKHVQALQTKLDNGTMVFSSELVQYLKMWLSKHILIADKQYIACFRENGVPWHEPGSEPVSDNTADDTEESE